jgi:MFS transporter, OFA family, oxalate/formate antiporter
MKRYWILLAAVVMQLCLGATYSWSVFVHPLRELTGLSQAAVQLPFTLFYFAFPLTVIFAGYMLKKFGPSISAAAGGCVFGLGWVLASLGTHNFAWTVAGIGVVAGVGVGLAYVVPISVLVRWFPRQKGLVTGVAVAGFGAGAALVSQTASHLLSRAGSSPFTTFGILGSAFLVVATIAGLFMRYPEDGTRCGEALLSVREIIRRREFRVLYGVMIIALASGFVVNANMKELFPSGGLVLGTLGVSLFAVCNAVGRMVWGALFDRTTPALALRSNLIGQALLFAASPLLLKSEAGFIVFACGAGFNYGGVLVLYAATVTHVWGAESVGQVYGLLFSANIIAAPAPMVAGLVYDSMANFSGCFLGLSILLILGAFARAPGGQS